MKHFRAAFREGFGASLGETLGQLLPLAAGAAGIGAVACILQAIEEWQYDRVRRRLAEEEEKRDADHRLRLARGAMAMGAPTKEDLRLIAEADSRAEDSAKTVRK
ncbi:MAG: hypothetical protein ACRDVE_18060 [Actinocrinis sp.]